MSDEVILSLSFDNQTVTDLTGNWTLDGTPNATYEQIEGRDGYSIVTGSLGRCIVLNAVDQNTVYNEYTVDFDMFVKSTYTSSYYGFKIIYMWSLVNPGNEYNGRIGNVLDVRLQIGGSEPAGTTDYSPIGRWVHVTLTSGLTEVADQYCTTVYVDGVKLIDRTDIRTGGVNPFALSQQIMLLTRDTDAKLMPNGPGICLNTFKVVAGIHAPDQKPAISLLNLRRVFNNFCTWLKGQLSTVALTGSYNDLSDKPTISTVNDGTLTIQKNGTNVATFTANQSTAATANITVPVNTSDLVNDSGFITSSSLPTVNNGTLTIQKNGTDVTTFTANQSSNATANITVPTAVSELANDSGYLTSSSNLDASKLTSGTVDIARLPQGALERLIKVANEAARYALTIADVQLGDTVQQLDTGIMYVVTDTDHLDSAAGYTEYTAGTAASVPWSGVTGKPTFAAVATSGAYSDLTGTPTIPTVNNATLTIQQNGVNVQTFTANASTNATANITVPTKTSDLTNDSGFITSDNTKIPLAGSNQISGSLIPATTDAYDLGGSSYQWNNAYIKSLTINGVACGNILTHNASEFVPRSGGDVLSGGVFARNVNTDRLVIFGGVAWSGSSLRLHGGDNPDDIKGVVLLQANDGTNIKNMTLYPNGTWTWNGTACQITSDQRYKQQITEIDDKLLDAWEDVNLVQFKYNDAVDQKSDNARLHTGYVVQQIDEACKNHDVDISEYGLYCHEEYPEETEEVEVEQADGTKAKERKVIREASEHYSLRYTEALIVECAYLRKCIKELRSEIEQLKSSK